MRATGQFYGVGYQVKPGFTNATAKLELKDGLATIEMELRAEEVTLELIKKAIRVLGEKGMLSRPEWRGRGIN